MKHDDDVGFALKRLEVAGLLIRPVAGIMRMPDEVDWQPPREREGLIGGVVIYRG